MAFYGMNASFIGGVKFSSGQFKEVTDIGAYLTELGLMFMADFVCVVTSGILFWKYAYINLLDEGYKLLRMYCPLISVRMAGTMFTVSISI